MKVENLPCFLPYQSWSHDILLSTFDPGVLLSFFFARTGFLVAQLFSFVSGAVDGHKKVWQDFLFSRPVPSHKNDKWSHHSFKLCF